MWLRTSAQVHTVRRCHPPLRRPLAAPTVRWLSPSELDRLLGTIHQHWHGVRPDADLRPLCDLRMRVWCAKRGLEPMPRIAMAVSDTLPVGLACVRRAPIHRCAYLEQWAWHPQLDPPDADTLAVCEALLECVELWSLEEGWHGRVSAAPEIVPQGFRGRLGFYPRDPWTLLRAGALYGR
jgi:hypothetical protein